MVVMEERRLRTQDNPQAFLIEQTMATAFQAQPYHWPVVGWMGDLVRIGYADAVRFYTRYYDPSNFFIVAVGDFQKEKLLPAISQAFGDIPSAGRTEHFRYEDPVQMGERRVVVSRQAALPYIVFGYHVPSLTHPDAYVLEVAAALLSAGKSSRIYEILSEALRPLDAYSMGLIYWWSRLASRMPGLANFLLQTVRSTQ
jgi:zinc protease